MVSPYKSELDLLALNDPNIANMVKLVGYPARRILPQHWHTFVKLIVEQQLSIQVADKVWARLRPLLPDEYRDLIFDDTQLLAAGLSKPKLQYLKNVHAALTQRTLDLKRLQQNANDEVIAEITAIKGLGMWTAHCYLLFALERADVFPIGDLALLRAWQFVLDNKELSPKDLEIKAENWHPHQSAVALLSWKYYSYKKRAHL